MRTIVNDGYFANDADRKTETRSVLTRIEYAGRTWDFPEGQETVVSDDVADYVRSMYAGRGLRVVATPEEEETARQRALPPPPPPPRTTQRMVPVLHQEAPAPEPQPSAQPAPLPPDSIEAAAAEAGDGPTLTDEDEAEDDEDPSKERPARPAKKKKGR